MSEKKWSDLDGLSEKIFEGQTDFDYEKWDGLKATVKLLDVNWDHEDNVVDWQSVESRNEWFDRTHDIEYVLETNWNMKTLEIWKPGIGKHSGSVILPIPFEEAQKFNYVSVTMYEQPVDDGGTYRKQRFFYHSPSLNKLSPNATEFFIELDSWTTFRPYVDISNIDLNRGHAPHAEMTAEKFLQNPLENAVDVTTVEPDLPSIKNMVADEQFFSMSKSDPRVCIATTGDFRSPKSWMMNVPTAAISDPDAAPIDLPSSPDGAKKKTYWNIDPFSSKDSVYNQSDYLPSNFPKVSVAGAQNAQTTINALRVYSMTPDEFPGFIAKISRDNVNILDSIKAFYILDGALITETEEFEFLGYTFKEVVNQPNMNSIGEYIPNIDSWGYTEEEKQYAKLYTGQFSHLEVSNLNGKRVEIAVEDIAEKLDLYARTSSMLPFLRMDAIIDGVGGNGSNTYTVKPLSEVDSKIFRSMWEDHTFEIDIPTYSIYAAREAVEGQKRLLDRQNAARELKLSYALDRKKAALDKTINTSLIELDKRTSDRDNKTSNAITVRSYGVAKNISERVAKKDQTISKANALNDFNIGSRSSATERDNAVTSYSNEFNSSNRSIATALANDRRSYDADLAISQNALSASSRLVDNEINRSNYLYRQENRFQLDLSNYSVRTEDLYFKNKWRNGAEDYNEGGIMADVPAQSYYGIWSARQRAAISDKLWEASNLMAEDMLQIGVVGQFGNAMGQPISVGMFSPLLALMKGYSGLSMEKFKHYGEWGMQKGFGYERKYWRGSFNNSYGEPVLPATYTKSYVDLYEVISSEKADKDKANSYSMENTRLGNINREAVFDLNSKYDRSGWTVGTSEPETFRFNKVYDTTKRNVEAASNTETTNTRSSFDTSAANVGRTFNNNAVNLAANLNNSNSNIDNAFGVSVLNYTDEFNRSVANERDRWSTSSTNINDRYNTKIANLNSQYADSGPIYTEINNRYNLGKARFNTEFLNAAAGDPVQYGVDSADSISDLYGTRGLSVRVIRCSNVNAKKAEQMFRRRGYTVGSKLIDSPKLSMMSKFTYWKANEVSIKAGNINETNRTILKEILMSGVTVWTDPDAVLDYNDNMPL